MNEYLRRIQLALYIIRFGDSFIRNLIAQLNIEADKLERAIIQEDKKDGDSTGSD